MTEPKTTNDDDPLAVLRERIRATQDAAAAMAADAEAAIRAGVPPQGYSSSSAGPAQTDDDLRALLGVLETLRGLVPAELQQQVSQVIRQVLLLLRALIDLWVARLEPGGSGAGGVAAGPDAPPRVQDIPVV